MSKTIACFSPLFRFVNEAFCNSILRTAQRCMLLSPKPLHNYWLKLHHSHTTNLSA